jgi:hypothetical protein
VTTAGELIWDGQQLQGFIDLDFASIDVLLTPNAKGRPRQSGHSLWSDLLLTMQADAKGFIGYPGQRKANLPKHLRISVKAPNR